MSYRSRVETPARLHFGFMSLSRSRERLYGGLGVAVDRPGVAVEAEPSSSVEVEVADHVVDRDMQRRRAEGYLSDVVEHLDLSGVSVTIESGVPVHAGLGSGTQTALAVADAAALAHGEELGSTEAARVLGRGSRSGVGVGVYRHGGFVLDAGVASESADKVPAVAARLGLPEDWSFVLVPGEGRGVHGDLEEDLVDEVLSCSDPRPSLSEAVVSQVLPGAAEADLERFGSGVARVGAVNGEVYRDAGVQEARYSRPDVVAELQEFEDVYGAGQSSWGPTVYALTRADCTREVVASFEDAFVAEPDHSGATSKVAPL